MPNTTDPDVADVAAGTLDRHDLIRRRRVADLRRTLVAGGYLLTRTASGAFLLEDAHGAPIATLRIMC